MKIYEHRQIGYLMLGILAGVIILTIISIADTGYAWPPIMILLVIALCVVSFSTLTVVIEDGALRFWFGPGFFRKRFLLQDIDTIQAVRNPWYYGWGIHLFPGGWVYNVSGFRAVEIKMKSGKKLRLGTDEPEVLERAIRQQLPVSSSVV